MEIMVITAIVSAVATAVGIIAPLWKRFKSFTNSWELFMRDWSGEEARPGHDKEPGVMERLNNIDGQFKNNGGGSMKDAVDRIEKKLASIDKRLAEGDARFEHIEQELKKHG